MQTIELPVCNMDMYGKDTRHFWMEDLQGLLEKYPNLEFPHRSNFFCLMLVEKAQGEIIIDNQKIRLDESKIIIIKPRCISSININRQAKGKIISFTEDFFSLRYNNNVLHQFLFLKREAITFVRLNENQKERWIAVLQLMQDELFQQKKEFRKVLRSYLNIVLFELDRTCSTSPMHRIKNIRQDKIFEFEKLIEKNFQSRKLPSEYAEMMHLTANYLNKICKEETGQTAGKLIRKRVILEAQRLLQYTNFSINEIADQLGFENASYFITLFKKETKFPPDQFRRVQNI